MPRLASAPAPSHSSIFGVHLAFLGVSFHGICGKVGPSSKLLPSCPTPELIPAGLQKKLLQAGPPAPSGGITPVAHIISAHYN